MILIINPYVAARHELIKVDAVGHKDDIKTLDRKIRQDLQVKLDKIHPKLENHRDTLVAITDTPSLRMQYKQAIILYRAVMGYKGKQGLVDEIRALKKEIRNRITGDKQ